MQDCRCVVSTCKSRRRRNASSWAATVAPEASSGPRVMDTCSRLSPLTLLPLLPPLPSLSVLPSAAGVCTSAVSGACSDVLPCAGAEGAGAGAAPSSTSPAFTCCACCSNLPKRRRFVVLVVVELPAVVGVVVAAFSVSDEGCDSACCGCCGCWCWCCCCGCCACCCSSCSSCCMCVIGSCMYWRGKVTLASASGPPWPLPPSLSLWYASVDHNTQQCHTHDTLTLQTSQQAVHQRTVAVPAPTVATVS